MAAATPQTQAVGVANQCMYLLQQMSQLYYQVLSFEAQLTNQGAATILQSFATAAQNADGSIGTADGSPNLAHPMTVAGLNRQISFNNISAGNTILNAFLSFMNGGVVSTSDRRPTVDLFNGS